SSARTSIPTPSPITSRPTTAAASAAASRPPRRCSSTASDTPARITPMRCAPPPRARERLADPRPQMCVLFLAWHVRPDLPLVLVSNRDEAYERPTAPAEFWEDCPHVLAGRDLRAGGTWGGVSTDGRW